MKERRRLLRTSIFAVGLLAASLAVSQVWENPRDPTGILIPYRLVHLVHSQDLALKGATADLRSRDTFLFYQLGRDLVNRQYEIKHGIYGQAGTLSVPLYVQSPNTEVHGVPARFARDHSSSCGMCHSSVFREPSSGQTIGSTGGMGRNTPHFFGAGLVEMLGEQVRALILDQYDRDHDGLLSRAEVAKPSPVRIKPTPDAPGVDYGDLSPGPDGVPQLNSLFRIWYVDAQGAIIKDAVSMKDPRVAAFGFAVQVFGWGRGFQHIKGTSVSEGGESSTTRQFFTVAADFHMGLQAYDPTQLVKSGESTGLGGLARVSLNGAQQFDFGGSVDPGHKLTPTGLSLDDPDKDGHINELTEGDLDAVEFFLLHTPQPAVRATDVSENGRPILVRVGCTRCHVENWRIEARDEKRGLTGDRRLFRLETRSRLNADGVSEILGKLVNTSKMLPSGERVPMGGAATVERIYSDFKHWDLGPQYYERRFDGTVQKEHRTAPLWGVGSTAPYGHDGHFMTLDEAIRAHGGAAEKEGAAYAALPVAERELLVEYLKSLALYSTDEIPTDINGDGKIDEDFELDGQSVGYERFDARLLFAQHPKFKNVGDYTRHDGREMPLLLIENIPAAYGLELPARLDSKGTGFPDILNFPKGQGGKNDP